MSSREKINCIYQCGIACEFSDQTVAYQQRTNWLRLQLALRATVVERGDLAKQCAIYFQ